MILKSNLSYYLLYQIKDDSQNSEQYEVTSIFNHQGFVDDKLINKLYMGLTQKEGALRFETLQELRSFALCICQQLKAKNIYIVSNYEYNKGILSSDTKESYRELFKEYGTVLNNPDFENQQSGFFSKIFKRV